MVGRALQGQAGLGGELQPGPQIGAPRQQEGRVKQPRLARRPHPRARIAGQFQQQNSAANLFPRGEFFTVVGVADRFGDFRFGESRRESNRKAV